MKVFSFRRNRNSKTFFKTKVNPVIIHKRGPSDRNSIEVKVGELIHSKKCGLTRLVENITRE